MSNEQPIRLFLVDENMAVRRALAVRLARAQDLEVIGDTGRVDAAWKVVKQQHPDVVILESKRRDGAALRFCEQVCSMSAPPKVIVLTSFANEDERLSLQHLGIQNYLLKDIGTEELLRVIRGPMTGIDLSS